MAAPLTVLFLLATAPTAPEPRTIVFATAWDQAGEKVAGRLEIDLTASLSARGLVPVDLGRFAPPTQSSAEGDALFEEGKQAYDNLELDGAISRLSDCVQYFLKHPTVAQSERVAEAYLFLGAARLQNGARPAEVEADLANAASLSPALTPDPKLFDAAVQKAFAAARAATARKAKGQLQIISLPSGADVELNGQKMGLTPLAPLALSAGRAQVRVSRPGYLGGAAFPEGLPDELSEVSLKLTPVPLLAPMIDLARGFTSRAVFDSQALPSNAGELGTGLGARYVVLVGVKGTTADAQVWDLSTNNRLRDVKFELADSAAMNKAAETIELWVSRPAPAVYVDASRGAVPPVLKTWWFWTAVGVVVVGTTTAVVVATRPHSGFDVVLGTP